MGVYWKIRFLGGVHEKPIYRGELPKMGGLGQFANLREELGEKEGVVFIRKGGGGVITQCTLWATNPSEHDRLINNFDWYYKNASVNSIRECCGTLLIDLSEVINSTVHDFLFANIYTYCFDSI